MKRIFSTLALSAALLVAAEAPKVLVTPNGKTYHSAKCLALSRSKTVYSVTLDAAKAHNMKPCGICYREKAAPKASKSAWMSK